MPHDWQLLDSSHIDATSYDEEQRTLHLRFKTGAVYAYHDVPKGTYEDLLGASSPGAFLRSHLSAFRYSRA